MPFDASSRCVLLLHDGELADLRAIVERIGARALEAATDRPAERDWDVAVATPRYLEALAHGSVQPRAVRIAVVTHDTRTLRALCRRAGADLVVRRPVHPAALRLLLLHALYRGPDRRTPRVAVGTPVRFRAGLRLRRAVLVDLSVRGGRLLECPPVPPGRRVTLYITDPRASSRQIRVSGRVVRAGRGGEGGFAVAFGELSAATALRLREAVATWAAGPAAFHGCEALLMPERLAAAACTAGGPAASEPLGATTAPEAAAEALAPEPAEAEAAPCAPGADEAPEAPGALVASGWEASAGDASDAAEDDAADAAGASAAAEASEPADAAPRADRAAAERRDRRRAPRRAYRERRVVALGDEAARVLIGHDVSSGGMRVAPNPALRVGQRFRVALHGGGVDVPLVVDAEVARDDGERGFVLAFVGLSDAARGQLEKLLLDLPVLETCSDAAGGLVVSEIVGGEPA